MTRTEMIAQNIVKYRKLKGLTQNDVASYLGITRAGYSNYEQGVRSVSFETALQLGELFGVSTAALGYDEDIDQGSIKIDNKKTTDIVLTPHEKELIKSYRNNPDMQKPVDRLLQIEQSSMIKSFRAAKSTDNHEPEILDIQDLSKMPESDNDEI